MRLKHQENTNKSRKIFDEVYLAESDSLFRFCLIRVSDREQATDLVQEIFTRFWQNLNKGSVEFPRAFLYKVARNAIIDWYRKKKSISLESLADPETQEPYEQIHDSAILDSRLDGEGRFLISKIRDLSPGYRDVIYLRYIEGLSPPEIAKILDISTNATSVRINRGIEELRRLTGYDIENSSDDN